MSMKKAPYVALRSAGVTPGVKIEFHRSTANWDMAVYLAITVGQASLRVAQRHKKDLSVLQGALCLWEARPCRSPVRSTAFARGLDEAESAPQK